MEKTQIHTVQFKNFHVQAKEVMYHVFGDGCGSCHKSDTPVKSKGFPHFFVDDFLADTKRKTVTKQIYSLVLYTGTLMGKQPFAGEACWAAFDTVK